MTGLAHAGGALYAADNLADGSLNGVVVFDPPTLSVNTTFLTSGPIAGLATSGSNVFASLPGGVGSFSTSGALLKTYNNIGVDHFASLAYSGGVLYAADNLSDGSLNGVVEFNAASLGVTGTFLTSGVIDGLATNGTDIFASLPNGIEEFDTSGALLNTYGNIGVDHFDSLAYAGGVLYAADNLSDGSLSGVVEFNAANLGVNNTFLTSGIIDGLASDGANVYLSLPNGVVRTDLNGNVLNTYDNIGVDHFASLAFAPAGVPEPATWAMMIVGLGGLGAVARRRRAVMLAG